MVFSAAAVVDRLESYPQVMLTCGCSTMRSYIPGTAACPLLEECPDLGDWRNYFAAESMPEGR
jgi:hypothetical protein